MKREQLEHLIRAAADIADDDELIIIGSQAILGQFADAPEELLVSDEADIYPKNRPERWELIDGSIGGCRLFTKRLVTTPKASRRARPRCHQQAGNSD